MTACNDQGTASRINTNAYPGQLPAAGSVPSERYSPVVDCKQLATHLSAIGEGLRSDADVFGHTWRLRLRTAEEILCGEMEAGITPTGGEALVRLSELRSLDQFIITFSNDEGDVVASALSSTVPDESHFKQVVGSDTLACRFAHLESLGKGPWAGKLLLAFDQRSSATERRIIINEVPGIRELRVDLTLRTPVIVGHHLATKDFLKNPIGT
ncbi:MAG: hypothetical protein ACO1NQ_10365 [Flavobacteriales bacterium]